MTHEPIFLLMFYIGQATLLLCNLIMFSIAKRYIGLNKQLVDVLINRLNDAENGHDT